MQRLVLRAENLAKSYGKRQVVKDVSFEVAAGEIVGLLGPNGAGKTTAFNMVAGLLPPDRGVVTLGEHILTKQALYERARLGLGYLPQEATVFRGLTVLENVLAVLEAQEEVKGSPAIKPATEHRQQALALLKQYNLLAVKDNLGSELSGGERRRLEMARTLLTQPQVVLLDEPFAGVDPIAVAEIRGFIRQVCQSGIGILLTDHNVRETLRVCDRAYLISHGEIFLAGSPLEIVNDQEARRLYLGDDFKL